MQVESPEIPRIIGKFGLRIQNKVEDKCVNYKSFLKEHSNLFFNFKKLKH